MSTKTSDAIDDVKNMEQKVQRRRKTRTDGSKKPIRLVSSLGEGKLVDRFQNAMGEKENRKKSREKLEKDRKVAKEKRDQEIAKFQAEIDALLEDNPDPIKKKETKTYVPKLSGTVKGKFEALERKKQEEEKEKTETERRKRSDRDSREKKRFQIELAKKKLKIKEEGGAVDNEDDDVRPMKSIRTPGKINIDFEEQEKKRKEREKKRSEMQRLLRMNEEIRSMKQGAQDKDSSDDETRIVENLTHKAPGKLKTNFDELFKAKEEQQRQLVEDEKRRKLEEEKQAFRAARLAAGEAESESTSSMTSQTSSSEHIRKKPNRLAKSFTKFDVLEKQRIEEERSKIREKRKALLEEERRLFEEMREQDDVVSNEKSNGKEHSQSEPGKLNTSLMKFDMITQKKFEEDRNRIQEEKRKLLEEETLNFKKQQSLRGESSPDVTCSEDSEDEAGSTENGGKFRKRTKVARTPSKLDYSRRKFDVLERKRMDEERLKIQEQRHKLLVEEARLFEEAKQQAEQSDQSDQEDSEINGPKPGKLDGDRTKFDILTKARLEEEQRRIRNERDKLMKEERSLMEEERRKIKEQEMAEQVDDGCQESERKPRRLPSRLNKSFTDFDVIERKRKEEEAMALYEEKARKLEEEKRSFAEAREQMEREDNDNDINNDISITSPLRHPNKLPSTLTNFDVIETQRLEQERLRVQEERIRNLENEIKVFEEQRKQNPVESDDDITSGTKELIKSAKNSPRPKKLASSFTKFDVMERKRREAERRRLQEENARKLKEERRMFKECREQSNIGSDSDEEEKEQRIPTEMPRKMDIRGKIEAVIKAQEDAERKRIEETKFSRMTGEQQEMYLARQRQIEMLKQQLASAKAGNYSEEEYTDSDGSDDDDDDCYYYYSDDDDVAEKEEGDEGEQGNQGDEEENSGSEESLTSDGASSNDSGAYSGHPYFVQTLNNLSVKEGDPVRFDAFINATPHPKVTWYFKNRAIRNCADYQYINKGTQYSLYMNESFLDDAGEYACKATNGKGSASSKAFLTVIEADEE